MSKLTPLYSNVKLNCMITSDNHIDIKHPVPKVPMYFLTQSFKDCANSQQKPDAYITVGDITSRSSKENWELTRKCFNTVKPCDNIIITPGNHDTWNDDGYQEAMRLFLENTSEITGDKLEKPYFYRVINGYYIIVLGTTEDSGCEAKFGQQEIDWFEATMKQASQTQKPIFVFCHQSLNQRHGLPRTFDREEKDNYHPFDGGIGAESEAIEKILLQYKNVYFFSGHSHMGLAGIDKLKREGYSSIEEYNDLHLINLPSLACGNHHGDNNAMGIGFVLEVYDDRVVLRPRSFSRHRFVKNVTFLNGKHYYEAMIK